MSQQPIRLQDVPARFFDADWKTLRAHTRNEVEALCLLNAPHPDPADSGAVGLYEIGRRLLRDYRRLLINGDHIATGVGADGRRVRIPASDWIDFWPWIATGRANGPGTILGSIEIHESNATKRQRACEEWLAARPDLPSQKKVSVFDQAKLRFGDSLSHAIFNAAYKQVFGRKRGRPVAIKRKK